MPLYLSQKPPPLNPALPPSKCSCVTKWRIAWGVAGAWLWWLGFTAANAPIPVIRTVKARTRMPNNTKLIPETVTDTVIVSGRASGRTPCLHIPDTDDTPICSTTLGEKETTAGTAPNDQANENRWRTKDLTVYPETWRDWCHNCCERVVKEGLPDDPDPSDLEHPWRHEPTLRTLYESRGLTTGQIAAKYGTRSNTVRKWLDKFGIERRPLSEEVSRGRKWAEGRS